MRVPFIAGNWKMFKTKAEALEFAEEFKKLYKGTDVQTAICAPFTDLEVLVSEEPESRLERRMFILRITERTQVRYRQLCLKKSELISVS